LAKTLNMKKTVRAGLWLAMFQLAFVAFTQAQLTSLPDGGNKKATVTERIGVTDVTINYNRPAVKGREGKIWGQLVPVGYAEQGLGDTKAIPWRAGANENTTIDFSTDVTVEGQALPAGRYGFFVAYDPAECTLIFSRTSTAWGAFFYNPQEDALRVKVKPMSLDNEVERLRYEFTDQKENSAVIALQWEKLSIPFRVEVDYPKTQLVAFRRELVGVQAFNWQSYVQAAQWCAQRNTDLDEGLVWANKAIDPNMGGASNFQTLSTKAQILTLQGKTADADAMMKQAMPLGSVAEVHQYARQLLGQKRSKEAFDAFKGNYDRHPNEFTTNMGLARGYSANGDYKTALTYLKKAQAQAPDALNKANIEKLMPMLEQGKDIN
jgi:tetratricopeptide (TPR) repeat protein